MVVVAAACRKALVNAGWAICLLCMADSAWQWLQLPVEKPCFLAQTGVENTPFTLYVGTPFLAF